MSASSTAGVGTASVGLATEPEGVFAGPSPRIGFEATLQPDDAAAPGPGEPATATQIGRFAILRRVGAGAMGVVHAAYDEELDRRVAIKLLLDGAPAGSEERARMTREALAMARLSHPNVVQIHEVGEHAGQVFIAMEYVRGATLSQWLVAGERSWQEILDVFEQAGRGLLAAHRAGLVHRDFKPDNVLVGHDGRVRVADFGLAHIQAARGSDSGDSMTMPSSRHLGAGVSLQGGRVGTPAYMSPEQHDGVATDARSDQFSFCVALYQAVYQQHPFAAATVFQLAIAVHEGAVREPPAGHAAPAWVHRALATGLAPNPGHRHASMEVLLAELSRDPPAPASVWRSLATAAAVVGLAGLAWLALRGEPPPTAAELAAIAGLAEQARDAAARSLWVYPAADDPQVTAILRVVALEQIGGAAAVPARGEASVLRRSFAGELVALGDAYWDSARPYARDFYAQALVFQPDHPAARARGGLTPGELGELQDKATQGSFDAAELAAFEPLVILAEPDADERDRKLRAYDADPSRGSMLEKVALRRVLSPGARTSTRGAAEPVTPVATPVVTPAVVAVAAPPLPSAASAPPVVTQRPAAMSATRPAPAEPAPAEEPVAAARELSERYTEEGRRALKQGDEQEAARKFHQAVAVRADHAPALIGLSDLAFDGGDFTRAAEFGELAVKAAPNNADYRLILGDAYFKKLEYSKARAQYERAQALGSQRAGERLERVQKLLGAP